MAEHVRINRGFGSEHPCGEGGLLKQRLTVALSMTRDFAIRCRQPRGFAFMIMLTAAHDCACRVAIDLQPWPGHRSSITEPSCEVTQLVSLREPFVSGQL